MQDLVHNHGHLERRRFQEGKYEEKKRNEKGMRVRLCRGEESRVGGGGERRRGDLVVLGFWFFGGAGWYVVLSSHQPR